MNKCPIPKEREEMISQNLMCSGLLDCEACSSCEVYSKPDSEV